MTWTPHIAWEEPYVTEDWDLGEPYDEWLARFQHGEEAVPSDAPFWAEAPRYAFSIGQNKNGSYDLLITDYDVPRGRGGARLGPFRAIEEARVAAEDWYAQQTAPYPEERSAQEKGAMTLDEARKAKQGAKARLLRDAAWASENPLTGGDTPLDYVYELEQAPNPQAAVELMERWLARGDTSAYGALGVWDHVISTGPADYRAEFQKLADAVKQAARLLQGDREFLESWGETWDDYEQASEGGVVSDYLAAYADGKAGQVHGADRFWPAHLPRWELHEIKTPYYSDEEVGVRLKIYDARTDDFVYADENVPGPRGADNLGIDSVDVWDAHQGTIDLSWEADDDRLGWPEAQIIVNVDTRSEDLSYEIETDYEY